MKMNTIYAAIAMLLVLIVPSVFAEENSGPKDGAYIQLYENGVLFSEAHYASKEQLSYMKQSLEANPAASMTSVGDGFLKIYYPNGKIKINIVTENGRIVKGEKYDEEGKVIDDKLGVKSMLQSYDALAKATLRTLSTASETYATANMGKYPAEMPELTQADPPYLNKDYCDQEISGFRFACEMSNTDSLVR